MKGINKPNSFPDFTSHLIQPPAYSQEWGNLTTNSLDKVINSQSELYHKVLRWTSQLYKKNGQLPTRKDEIGLDGNPISVQGHVMRVAGNAYKIIFEVDPDQADSALIIGGGHDGPEDSRRRRFTGLRNEYEKKIRGANPLKNYDQISMATMCYRIRLISEIKTEIEEVFGDMCKDLHIPINSKYIAQVISQLSFLEPELKGSEDEKKEMKLQIIIDTIDFIINYYKSADLAFTYGIVKLLDSLDNTYTYPPTIQGLHKIKLRLAMIRQIVQFLRNFNLNLLMMEHSYKKNLNPPHEELELYGSYSSEVDQTLNRIIKLADPLTLEKKILLTMVGNGELRKIVDPQKHFSREALKILA